MMGKWAKTYRVRAKKTLNSRGHQFVEMCRIEYIRWPGFMCPHIGQIV